MQYTRTRWDTNPINRSNAMSSGSWPLKQAISGKLVIVAM